MTLKEYMSHDAKSKITFCNMNMHVYEREFSELYLRRPKHGFIIRGDITDSKGVFSHPDNYDIDLQTCVYHPLPHKEEP